jgi:hypothetical protein
MPERFHIPRGMTFGKVFLIASAIAPPSVLRTATSPLLRNGEERYRYLCLKNILPVPQAWGGGIA